MSKASFRLVSAEGMKGIVIPFTDVTVNYSFALAAAAKDKRDMNAKELMQLHRDQELLADNLNDLGMLLSTVRKVTLALVVVSTIRFAYFGTACCCYCAVGREP